MFVVLLETAVQKVMAKVVDRTDNFTKLRVLGTTVGNSTILAQGKVYTISTEDFEAQLQDAETDRR